MSPVAPIGAAARIASLSLLLALAGCATQSIRERPSSPQVGADEANAGETARAQWFGQHRDWSVTGRVAVSKAGKGGSGRLEWTQTGQTYVVALSAPITRQSWRLIGDTHSEAGRIEGLDGGPRDGEFADELLLEATGWDVPVNQLPDWMRGFAAPGMPVDELSFGADGHPARLRQAGWTVNYTRWSAPEGGRPALPSRIEATNDDAGVKLIVDEWTFPAVVSAVDADAVAGWSAWPAPAKLNLFLRITGRRADGYHALQTVFRLLDWGDTIRLRPRADGVIARHGASAAGVAEADDIAVKAARLLQKESNSPLGADIVVEKRIPVGGGFGGGSSDAATVLRALARLWRLDFDEDRLAALGLRLGADVPVFVRGRNAWAEGVGETLTPIALPPAWYLLADPGVHAATAELFAAAELTRNAAPATMADFVSGASLGNAFEPVLRRRQVAVEAAFAALSQVGSPRLTGSGSGCFVEFADRGSAQAALARLPSGLVAWMAEGAGRSPLLDALERPGTGSRE